MLRKRNGFTLIELLIVVVIIGILASIAIPKFNDTKKKTYLTTMKSDLRNLATSQEGYLHDNSMYYSGSIPGTLDYVATQGVSVTINAATGSGWAATTTHISTSETCAMYIGDAGPIGPADSEGAPKCTG